MQELAKELGVVLPVSFFEEANNAHYNSIAIIDADGTDLGLYRKSHIPDGPGMPFSCFIPSEQIKSKTI
jgi:N-carbamoylputrescine amidase